MASVKAQMREQIFVQFPAYWADCLADELNPRMVTPPLLLNEPHGPNRHRLLSMFSLDPGDGVFWPSLRDLGSFRLIGGSRPTFFRSFSSRKIAMLQPTTGLKSQGCVDGCGGSSV